MRAVLTAILAAGLVGCAGVPTTKTVEVPSAVPGLVAAKVPLLLVYAELDPPDFHTQSEQLNAALCKAGQCPGLYKLMGHSHMSEIYSINSADKTVGNLMKQWVDRVR